MGIGLYDDQIKERIKSDAAGFTRSFAELSAVVMGDVPMAALEAHIAAKNAIETILKYYHVPIRELPDDITDINDQLEYLMRPSGIMRRRVRLTEGWYKDADGALLGQLRETGEVVALLPNKTSGYSYTDYTTGKQVRMNKAEAAKIAESAYSFYRPLPLRKINVGDFFQYILKALSPYDFVLLGALTLVVTLVGLLTPYINNQLFGNIIANGDFNAAMAAGVVLAGAAVSTFLIDATESLVSAKIQSKSALAAQSAMMMRILSLPPAFFKDYSSGELENRVSQAETLCAQLTDSVMVTALTSVLSLTYVTQVFRYAPTLAVPALLIILGSVVFSVIVTFAQLKVSKQQMEIRAKESGLVHSLFSGIQKLKLAGAERRAFAKWSALYAKSAKLQYAPPAIVVLGSVASLSITSVGTIVLYFVAVQSGIRVADYMAFNAAYGMVFGALLSLSSAAMAVARTGNTVSLLRPIFDAEPEISEGKTVVTTLSGDIDVHNVQFRYNANMPLVLDDVSLKITAGSYTAIVGATGCGKSTLMRIMLGFEMPQKGAVYFDGKDLAELDLKSLRRNNIGVVLQNGQLFQGDIYSNIVISAPWLDVKAAWEAAEIAGIADDIRAMPMGMHTKISEGSGGVSGGQRQRLMIARAVAPKPKIIMLDEATSALDNITQKMVSDALSRMDCTRIVIAHRLSTIRECDRILVMDKGKIAEDGTFDELLAKNGLFAELVKRQMAQ